MTFPYMPHESSTSPRSRAAAVTREARSGVFSGNSTANIGPSPKNYCVQRGSSEEIAKFTYEKIYNAWAYFPCSNMPRLGASGHLKPEQIVHLVAYLIDPASPINKR